MHKKERRRYDKSKDKRSKMQRIDKNGGRSDKVKDRKIILNSLRLKTELLAVGTVSRPHVKGSTHALDYLWNQPFHLYLN